MTVKEAMAVLTKVKPGTFGVRVHYTAPLPISSRAIKAGRADDLDQAGCFKEVTRLCRVKVKWYNTQYQKDRAAAGANETHAIPRGFKPPTDPAENGLIYYSIATDEPYLRLMQGGHNAVKNGMNVTYYVNGDVASFEEVEDLVNQKVFTAKAIDTPIDLPYFLLKLDKVSELTLMGKEAAEEEEPTEEESTESEEINEAKNEIKNPWEHLSMQDKLLNVIRQAGKSGISREEALNKIKFSSNRPFASGSVWFKNLQDLGLIKFKDNRAYIIEAVNESLDLEAQKWGYRNYKEYLNESGGAGVVPKSDVSSKVAYEVISELYSNRIITQKVAQACSDYYYAKNPSGAHFIWGKHERK